MRTIYGHPKIIGAIIVLAILLGLAGCAPKETLVDPPVNSDIQDKVEDKNIDNKESSDSTKKYDYAKDNPSSKTSKDYHSGILAGDVKLSNPYTYTGKTIEGSDEPEGIGESLPVEPSPGEGIADGEPADADTEPGDIDSELADNEPEDTELEDEEGANIEDDSEGTIDDTEPSETISPEEDKKNESMGAALDLQDIVIRGIINNGISLLSGAESEQRFNESHDITMTQSIKSLKNKLERIEYCDTLVSEYFSEDINLVNSWEIIKADLISIRSALADVNTAEGYMELSIELSKDTSEVITDFTNSIQSHQVDTSEGGETA